MSKEILRRIETLERRLTPPKERAGSFGGRLAEMRGNAGLTIRALAMDVGLSNAYICQLENNRSAPTATVLYKLAQRLGVSMDYLWTGE